MRSVERAARSLEHYYLALEKSGPHGTLPEQACYWIERIRYWSEDSHAKALFEQPPIAMLWCVDTPESALYGSLLGREGYSLVSADELAQMGSYMDSQNPPALLCVIERDPELAQQVLAAAAAHPEWMHAPTLLFAPETVLPSEMEIFHPAERPTPGVLMTSLEAIREATS
jgi:hypothetical protein